MIYLHLYETSCKVLGSKSLSFRTLQKLSYYLFAFQEDEKYKPFEVLII